MVHFSFPSSFSIFHVDLLHHLSSSCVLSKGWACASLLIYSFIFENKNDDWLFFPLIYLLAHTCFFHSGFLQVLACIFSPLAFCSSFLLCDYAISPGPPSPSFWAASPGFAWPSPASAVNFAAWLRGSPVQLWCHRHPSVPSRFCQHTSTQFEHYRALHRFVLGSALSITTACRKHCNDCVVVLGLNCMKQGPMTYFQNEWKVYKSYREEKWYSCS